MNLSDGLGRPVRFPFLYTNTSPPVIVRDIIIVGSSILDYPVVKTMPPGDVRGFDVRTGKQLWTFRSHAAPDQLAPSRRRSRSRGRATARLSDSIARLSISRLSVRLMDGEVQ